MLTVVCHHCRSSARITVLQMMANFDNYPWISLRRMAGLALFTFCNNFVQIGNQSAAQPQKIYTICWLTLLFFLTHKPSPLHPSSPLTLRCCSLLLPLSQPFNTTLLFPPHPPKSTLQQFAAVLPSRAEVNPPTLRCCSPLTRRSQPFNSSLLFSPHGLKFAFNTSLPLSAHRPEGNLPTFAAVLPPTTKIQPTTTAMRTPPHTRKPTAKN